MNSRIFVFSFLFVFLLPLSLLAQRRIAVQNGGTSSFYTELDSAIINAQAGDSIFLPGGVFQTSSPLIDKTLHIIGVGHHPDSTAATNFTRIIGGDVILVQGADNSSLIGFVGNIDIGSNANNNGVHGVKIESIYGSVDIRKFSGIPNTSSDFIIQGNIISFLRGGESIGHFVVNNYVGSINGFEGGGYFANNLVVTNKVNELTGNWPLQSIDYCTFNNNVFFSTEFLQFGVNNTVFNNNICASHGTGDDKKTLIGSTSSGNQEVGTIYSQDMTILFEDLGLNIYSFAYEDDYQVKSGSPGKNYGTDGTDVGVYGGVFAWKPGNIPFNPHIQSVTIDPMTDGNGGLQVKIKVEAQRY